MSYRFDSFLDYFSKGEREVAKVLKNAGISYRHGIGSDGVHPPETMVLENGVKPILYIPDIVLPDYPNIVIEAKDLSVKRMMRDWERKFLALASAGITVILVIPDEKQAYLAENMSNYYLNLGKIEELPELIRQISDKK